MTKITKYKLPFINGDKEFEIPNLTLGIHEKAMDTIGGLGKMKEEKYSRLLNKQIMLEVLKTVDSKVTMDDITGMHPQDYLELFGAIWNSGLVRKSDKPFRDEQRK